jgi:PhoPQ-activated pathogenicity-related protein
MSLTEYIQHQIIKNYPKRVQNTKLTDIFKNDEDIKNFLTNKEYKIEVLNGLQEYYENQEKNINFNQKLVDFYPEKYFKNNESLQKLKFKDIIDEKKYKKDKEYKKEINELVYNPHEWDNLFNQLN